MPSRELRGQAVEDLSAKELRALMLRLRKLILQYHHLLVLEIEARQALETLAKAKLQDLEDRVSALEGP